MLANNPTAVRANGFTHDGWSYSTARIRRIPWPDGTTKRIRSAKAGGLLRQIEHSRRREPLPFPTEVVHLDDLASHVDGDAREVVLLLEAPRAVVQGRLTVDVERILLCLRIVDEAEWIA